MLGESRVQGRAGKYEEREDDVDQVEHGQAQHQSVKVALVPKTIADFSIIPIPNPVVQ